jgi:hypothetical protein
MRPLDLVKLVGNGRAPFWRIVNDDRNQKRSLFGNVSGAIRRETPLAPEITLVTGLRTSRNDRYEQTAAVDLLANLAIPNIASPQLALIEPDLYAGCTQCIANLLRRFGILRGIAQEHRPSR